MSLTTLGGTWHALRYAATGGAGAEMELEFQPNKQVNSKKIGLIQSNARYDNNKSTDKVQRDTLDNGNATNPQAQAKGERSTGTSHIDRSLTENNPIYGAPTPKSGKAEDTAKGTYMPGYRTDRGNKTMQNYELGHQYKDLFHKRHTKSAKLYDAPNGTVGDGGMHFEVTAVGLEGADKGRFFGSVKWGYSVAGGNVTLDNFEVASLGTPSQEFTDAGTRWNTAHASKANKQGQQELIANLAMPTTAHRSTLRPDEMNDREAVARRIDDLEADIDGHNLTGIDLKNAQWELKALKAHHAELGTVAQNDHDE